jgi:hypothetical protein
VRYGVAKGWKVSVLAGALEGEPTPAGAYLLGKVPDPDAVTYVRPPALTPAWGWFPRINGGFPAALRMVAVAAEKWRDRPPGVVLASGPPFHSFVAAYYIARMFRAKLALDYRDEWTESPFDFPVLGNVDRKWEARCLARADRVFFTTPSMQAHQVKAFPMLDPAKCRVIFNGWEPEDAPAPRPVSAPPEGEISVSFVGILGSHCLPGAFLKSVEEVLARRPDLRKRVRLRFVGTKDPEAAAQLRAFRYPERLSAVDQVPKPDAVALMKQSSALLLLNDPNFERYIPGKLYDYLAAGRPVLVFGRGGEIERLVTELRAGLCVDAGAGEGLEKALDALGDPAHAGPDRAFVETWLAGRTRRTLAEEMLAELESLPSPEAPGRRGSPA